MLEKDDFDKVVDIVKKKVSELYEKYKLDKLDTLLKILSSFELTMVNRFSKYDTEAMMKSYYFNYYKSGKTEIIEGYGIDILKKFGIPLMEKIDKSELEEQGLSGEEDLDNELMRYLNEVFDIESRTGHFQVHKYPGKSMSKEEFKKKFDNFDKVEELKKKTPSIV